MSSVLIASGQSLKLPIPLLGTYRTHLIKEKIMNHSKKSKFFYVLFGAVLSLGAAQVTYGLESTDTLDNANSMNNSKPTLQRARPLAYYHDAPKSDVDLTKEITEQLTVEEGIDINKLNLEVVEGIVKISGTAKDAAIVKRIMQIASSAGSVKYVESTVKIEAQVSMESPLVMDAPIIMDTPVN